MLALGVAIACTKGNDGDAELAAAAPTRAANEASEGTPRATARPASSARAERILFIGTSLTAGLGLDPSDAFPAVVGRMLDSAGRPAEVVNAGVSGETSAGALRRIDWVLRTPADIVVIETGANDGLRGLSVTAARSNIAHIIDRIREQLPDARILLVQMEAPPNMGARYTSEFRAMFPELAREKRVELVPFLLEGVAGEASLNQEDGIHPNRAGTRIVARTMFGAITSTPRRG
ncbi:MAG TPA: arylesterase [Gemmatimonadaceae bacterium]|nr:arylesterase [Gemmatimonadaceae bacterium]